MTTTTLANSQSRSLGREALAALVGAVLVAIGAQISFPIPGTPVPFSLQPLIVLAVGALLPARAGFAALVMYLIAGCAGLPVFANIPGLPMGAARLFGPTGGYLLAFPIAAAVTGALVGKNVGKFLPTLLAAVVGMVIIHIGGIGMLLIQTGATGKAFEYGALPFLVNDVLKVLAVALLGALTGKQVLKLLTR